MHPLIAERLGELIALCARFGVRTLALFGSAAAPPRGTTPRDIDFLVEFQPMSPPDHADSYFGLLESLEDLLQRPVDLVEPAAIRNPYFRQAVESTKVGLYAAA